MKFLKKGLNNKEINLVLKGASLFDKYNISKKNKTIPLGKIKLIEEKIKKQENEHIANIFDKYSNQLFEIKNSIKKDLDQYVIKYNEQVFKINKFLNNKEERIWKFEVEEIEIETVFDEIKIKYT